MIKEVLKSREGRFFGIGTVFFLLGFIFQFSSLALYARISFYIAIFFLGYFATKEAIYETIFERKLNVDLLMVLAALGAVLINYESEGAALLFIFAGAEVLEEYATSKSTKAITELMGHVPDTAQLLLDNGEVREVPTEELKLGDTVVVARGENIPIDGLIDREVLANEAALTGESLPVLKHKDEEVFAGTINVGDSFHLTVNKRADETVFSSIIRMVEEAQSNPSKIASFIDRFESKYAIGVLVAVPLFILVLYAFAGYNFQEAFYRGMVLLTVASPCALVASATPATLSAISNGAKNGVLVKGGAAMESLATMDILYSDKTGTITEGNFAVVDYQLPEDVLIEVVYMEQQSNHPIANAIVKHFSDVDLSHVDQSVPVEEVTAQGMKKGQIRCGKPTAFENYKYFEQYAVALGKDTTTILVGDDHQVLGYITLEDQVRPLAVEAIKGFQKEGIEVSLLTGDNPAVAQKVAHEVGIEDFTANCLPEDKIKFVKDQQAKDNIVGMIGDGINDAPALANANIGIAMGSGSSVAMESADVIIVKNNLAKLLYSYRLSHKLNRIILQNVIFAVSVIVFLIILNLMGILDLPAGVVFHEGSTILVILNGLRLLRQSDHQDSEKQTEEKKVPASV